jgi:outer membrane protein TolC
MATGFIRFDNAREDYELGLVSELEVLRLQSEYELVRQQRNLAEQRQRLTRARLAEAMGYPDRLPSELVAPEIDPRRKLPGDPAELWTRAMRHSQRAVLARANTQVAQAAIGIAESSDGPRIDFEIELATYQRDSRLRDDARLSVYFDIPLYSQTSPARVDLAMARFEQSLAQQQQIESALRLEVLELWQQLRQLQIEIEGHNVEQYYRDRYLDRSRAEYELEFKTDLGDSMVLYSRSNEARMRSLYAFELAYQRLVDLVGADYLDQLTLLQ